MYVRVIILYDVWYYPPYILYDIVTVIVIYIADLWQLWQPHKILHYYPLLSPNKEKNREEWR